MKTLKGFLIAYLVSAYLPFAAILFLEHEQMVDSNFNHRNYPSILLWACIGIFFLLWIISLILEVCFSGKRDQWNNPQMLLFFSIIKSLLVPFYVLNFITGIGFFAMGFITGVSFFIAPFMFFSSFGALLITSLPNTISLYYFQRKNENERVISVLFIVFQWIFVVDLPLSWVSYCHVRSIEMMNSKR